MNSLPSNYCPNTDMDDTSGPMPEQGTPAQNEFFQLLHKMISNESHTGIIEWTSDNKGFVIPFKKPFCDRILPRYFGKAKYTSFTRRLKRWGFKRVSSGLDVGSYYNAAFYRNMVFDMYEYDNGLNRGSPFAPSSPPMNEISYAALPLKKRSKQMRSPEPFLCYEMEQSPPRPTYDCPPSISAKTLFSREDNYDAMHHNMFSVDYQKRREDNISFGDYSEAMQDNIMSPLSYHKRKERVGIVTPPSKKVKLTSDVLIDEIYPSAFTNVNRSPQRYFNSRKINSSDHPYCMSSRVHEECNWDPIQNWKDYSQLHHFGSNAGSHRQEQSLWQTAHREPLVRNRSTHNEQDALSTPFYENNESFFSQSRAHYLEAALALSELCESL